MPRKSKAIFDPNPDDSRRDLKVNFEDDFSPGSAKARLERHSEQEMQRLRPLFYNDQIHELLAEAIEICSELGLPKLQPFEGNRLPSISREEEAKILPLLGDLFVDMEEQSESWLAAVCYLNYLNACVWSTDKDAAAKVAENMMFVGATVRELQLAKLNKKAAATGKKVSRGQKAGARQTEQQNAQLRNLRFRRISELLENGHTLSSACKILETEHLGNFEATRKQWSRYNR